jgi:hypothetical protein
MKNIHLIATDKPSRLTKNNLGKLIKLRGLQHQEVNENQNIYITSDEEAEEGDWVIYRNSVFKIERGDDVLFDLINVDFRKVILTTDQELIKEGVQAIDDEFLEWFVKNPSCEMVEIDSTCKCVTCNSSVKSSCDYAYKCRPQIFYKIIIPQEEQTKCYCGHTSFCDCGPQEEPKKLIGEKVMPLDNDNIEEEETNQDTVGKEFYESADKTITVKRQETFIKTDNVDGQWLSPVPTERAWQEEKLVEIFEHYPNASPRWQYMNGLIQNSLDAKQMYSEDQVKKAIIELESKLKKLRVADVSVSDCISKNEVLHYMDIDTVGACSKCGSMKQYEH